MFKFFRRIRQSLMSQGKSGQYFLYAIGEIILVVVGILIALSINNWNQDQKDRAEEVEILKALKVEFIESKRRIDETMELQSMVVQHNIRLCDFLAGSEVAIDSMPEIFDYGSLIFFRAEPVTGTYDALIGAGKTILIQNKELGRYLSEYSAEINLGYEDHEYGMILNGIILDKTSAYNGPFLSRESLRPKGPEIDKAAKMLLDDKSIVGIIYKKQGIETRRLQWQQSLSKQVGRIVEIVDAELAKKDHHR